MDEAVSGKNTRPNNFPHPTLTLNFYHGQMPAEDDKKIQDCCGHKSAEARNVRMAFNVFTKPQGKKYKDTAVILTHGVPESR